MPVKKQTDASLLDATKVIYESLLPLDEQARQRVINSVLSLLGVSLNNVLSQTLPTSIATVVPRQTVMTGDRPLSPLELIQQKKPSTNPEKLALFAYFREKHEGFSRFSRSDLKIYFAKAKLTPPQNYDRDFNNVVKLGFIYEDGADSYLTSKGLEAVESGFSGSNKSLLRKVSKRKSIAGKSQKKK